MSVIAESTKTCLSFLSFQRVALVSSVLISIILSSVFVTTTTTDAISNLKSLFSSSKKEEPRPNNNYEELVSFFGEDGYHDLVMIALGLDSISNDDTFDDGTTNDETTTHQKATVQNYGLDTTYPAQHVRISQDDNNNNFAGKQAFYESTIQGCRDYYTAKECDNMEQDRIQMNLVQPKLMVNYTALGFQKQKLAPLLMNRIKQFWETATTTQEDDNNDDDDSSMMVKEMWTAGNTFTNHWDSPTFMLHIPTTTMDDDDGDDTSSLRTAIYQAVEGMIHQWIKDQEFVATSIYGIRVYKEGAILAPHVDRLPLVTSAIIHVAQDVDEDWPLEVYGHDGKVYNVTLKPGEVLLYESHSIIHGRPFPLQGRYYANIFVHFEPKGYSQHFWESSSSTNDDYQPSAKQHYRKMKKNKAVQQIDNNKQSDIPFYIEKGGIEEKLWNPKTKKTKQIKVSVDFLGSMLTVHQAAARGDLEALQALRDINPDVIHEVDKNGWQPIHEAARGGHTDVVEYLVTHGVDINARTNGGIGGTPLYHAKEKYGSNHGAVKILEKLGAKGIKPEL